MKIGTTELIVILVIVVLLVGPTQIPKLAKMFGKSVKGLREGMNDGEKKVDETVKETVDESKEN